ncbi:hypothetical protein [Paraburkholderia strydomiana]|uniref:hypothetical protein n=1 Tax=Paraburkholderia strydomiana TaxID=1245417 RepID=UPI00285F1DB0|nr:hypothetical protein [Paraburkholderia strydomiana]MDR7006064.1 hypothetical protein [Paraburkholderia strydomiana]
MSIDIRFHHAPLAKKYPVAARQSSRGIFGTSEIWMNSRKKQFQGKRGRMLELIREYPGITSGELAEKVGVEDSSSVSSAMWTAIRRGHVMVERVIRNGKSTNAHYHPDQVPPDAVERVQQKLVNASQVIPISTTNSVRSSVFDVPGAKQRRKKQAPRKAPSRAPAAAPSLSATAPAMALSASPSSQAAPRTFACAITNDGSLVLMRSGEIQFSLTDVEAATLQSYLLKRAAASMLASMV